MSKKGILEDVRFFTRLKTVTTRWFSGIRSGAVFNFAAGGWSAFKRFKNSKKLGGVYQCR